LRAILPHHHHSRRDLFPRVAATSVLVATVLAAAGYYKFAMILLGAIVVTGIALAIINWRLG
jgi:small-conductance mechanosensitive channel